jgi:predicted enzyme related to lactoylglutathione lyase
MKKVTGIGGIFFKTKNPQQIKEWYGKHLGFNIDPYGTMFETRNIDNPEKKTYTVWSPFKEDTNYFEPSTKEFMINYQVENLEALLKVLQSEGIEPIGEMQVYEYGKFAHIMDPEGNKIELWEPA